MSVMKGKDPKKKKKEAALNTAQLALEGVDDGFQAADDAADL